MQSRRHDWIKSKCSLASALAAGQCGGSYAEAALILCAALSALAADAWPGEKTPDRKRFVELLVRFAADRYSTAKISVPLLAADLRRQGMRREAKAISQGKLGFSSRVLRSVDIDLPEEKVLLLCPDVPLGLIRKYSYASLLYKEIRNGYAHEYSSGDSASEHPMTDYVDSEVSYVNRIDPDNPHEHVRLVHFHVPWLIELAEDTARALDRNLPAPPFENPQSWWLDAGS